MLWIIIGSLCAGFTVGFIVAIRHMARRDVRGLKAVERQANELLEDLRREAAKKRGMVN